MNRALLTATALLLLVTSVGCRGFLPPESRGSVELAEGETSLPLGMLRRKQTVEVEGHFEDGRFVAARLELEEDDDETTVKGTLRAWDPTGFGSVGEITFSFGERPNLRTMDGEALEANRLAPGAWVKAECIDRGGTLHLRKLTVRERGEGERAELQGVITGLDLRDGVLKIGDVEVSFGPTVPLVWDVADQEPPTPEEIDGLGLVSRGANGRRRLQRRDFDDRRPLDQFTVGDFLTIGGEIQYELEWRGNHDLRDARKRDRLIHQASTALELSFDLGRHVFAFGQFRMSQDIIHFHQGPPRGGAFKVRVGEAFVLLEDLPVSGFSLQVGRQDVDYGREWVVDDQLDAVRAYVNLDVAILDFSISSTLFDASREEDGITNFFAGLYSEEIEDHEILLYFLHRKGGSLVDLARNHLGVSVEAEIDAFQYWLDLAAVFGREGDLDVRGFGVDVAAMLTLESVPAEPYVFAGFAWGSGDDDPSGGTDGNFRQSGLHDNNDRFGGVTSFRYLGELVRPELSNLMVLTAGVGVLLAPRTSLDLVFHHYRQVDPAPSLRDTRIRFAPNGDSPTLGNEVDLIIGIEEFRPVEVEIVLGYFAPGSAFGDASSAAWFFTFQIELNF